MNHKYWGLVLGTAVLSVLALIIGPIPGPGELIAFFSFPFAQIGSLLRRLSLAGPWGNIRAVGLYGILALSPLAFFLWRLWKKKARIEDALLVLMSAFLFFMLYLMVNPFLVKGLFPQALAAGDLSAQGKFVLGAVFYSLLIGYLVLSLLRRLGRAEAGETLGWLQRLLVLIAAIMIFSLIYLGVGGLLASIRDVGAANTDPSASLAVTNLSLLLRFILEQVPTFMGLGLLNLGVRLAEALKKERFGEETVAAATRLGRLCKATVAATVLSAIVANLLQLAYSRWLLSTHFSAFIPLSQLAITLVLLVLAQYFAESSKLHRDNQLFI